MEISLQSIPFFYCQIMLKVLEWHAPRLDTYWNSVGWRKEGCASKIPEAILLTRVGKQSRDKMCNIDRLCWKTIKAFIVQIILAISSQRQGIVSNQYQVDLGFPTDDRFRPAILRISIFFWKAVDLLKMFGPEKYTFGQLTNQTWNRRGYSI